MVKIEIDAEKVAQMAKVLSNLQSPDTIRVLLAINHQKYGITSVGLTKAINLDAVVVTKELDLLCQVGLAVSLVRDEVVKIYPVEPGLEIGEILIDLSAHPRTATALARLKMLAALERPA